MRTYQILFCGWIAIISSVALSGQGYNIGIRAGIGQTKFVGPTEENANESFSLSGGFHFGINFQWNFTDLIGIRSEILYNQSGSGYTFESEDGYYLYRELITGAIALDPSERAEWPLLRDQKDVNLEHSNAYIQLPQTLHLRATDKFEIFAGGYIGFLLNPLATGTMSFGGDKDLFENPYVFNGQGLDFDYNSDRPGQFNGFDQSILLIVNGEDVDIPGTIGAYYFFEDESEYEYKYKSIDYGLIGGFTYYLNRGLYTSLRVEYGLNDITRTAGDISLQDLNSDKTFVYRDDFDRNVGFYLSLGFKF